jgi:pyridoxine 5-phosphate synthase
MHRLALGIDIIALIRNLVDAKEPDPIQSVILAELGGVESIVCYLRDDLKTVNERDIALLKQIVRTHLNVRSNLTEENIRKLMRVKPDMLTFVNPGEMSAIEPDPLNLEMYESQIFNYNAELRTNNILTSALIEPDINQVKSAGKLEFDYVEISAHSLHRAADMNEELDILDNIASLTLAANKLGLGVNLSGGIGYDNIKEIITIEYVEDIIIGKSILSKALAIGIEQAVRDMISML